MLSFNFSLKKIVFRELIGTLECKNGYFPQVSWAVTFSTHTFPTILKLTK